MTNQILTINTSGTYTILDIYDKVNIDTSVAVVNIVLSNIKESKFLESKRKIIINDIGNNASNNPITIITTGGDKINNSSSIVLNQNGVSIVIFPCNIDEWICTYDTSGAGFTGVYTDASIIGNGTIALPLSVNEVYKNILFVSPNGNNATAQKGRITLPYKDLETAISVSTDSDTIIVLEGQYFFDNKITINKNILVYCFPNVILYFLSGQFVLGEYVTFRLLGKANISIESGTTIFSVDKNYCNLEIEANLLYSETGGYLLKTNNSLYSKIKIKIKKVEIVASGVILFSIRFSDIDFHFLCEDLSAGNTFFYSESSKVNFYSHVKKIYFTDYSLVRNFYDCNLSSINGIFKCDEFINDSYQYPSSIFRFLNCSYTKFTFTGKVFSRGIFCIIDKTTSMSDGVIFLLKDSEIKIVNEEIPFRLNNEYNLLRVENTSIFTLLNNNSIFGIGYVDSLLSTNGGNLILNNVIVNSISGSNFITITDTSPQLCRLVIKNVFYKSNVSLSYNFVKRTLNTEPFEVTLLSDCVSTVDIGDNIVNTIPSTNFIFVNNFDILNSVIQDWSVIL
ncbi:MAG: hypothetical protein QXM96_00210 [Candidatus Woesearchaeota archaeon]